MGMFQPGTVSGQNKARLGYSWIGRTIPQSNSWQDIVWAPSLGLFVAVAQGGTNRVMTSPDGLTWTVRTISSKSWTTVTWSESLGLFVALAANASGNATVATSTNGTTWTDGTMYNGLWSSVTWSPDLGLFVGV